MLQQASVTPATGYAPNSKRSNCVARALFDNIAESQDELAFRKGELLTVLEQNANGLEGWWLCCLRGRQGIAPGNRLRLLPGVYDHTGLGYAGGPASTGALNGSSRSLASQPSPVTPHPVFNTNSESSLPNATSNSGTPTHCRRRSWHANPNKVVMPQRIGDVYLYDIPASARLVHPGHSLDEPDSGHSPGHGMTNSAYDVPIGSLAGNYDIPHSPRLVKMIGSTYDHPRSHSLPMMTYDTPKSIPNHDYDVPPNEMGEYDIPASPKAFVTPKMQDYSTYDVPLSHQIVTSSDNYVVPASQLILKKLRKDFQTNNMSNRSSGVSLVSTVSSPSLSPACSQSSLNASLSLSSLGGSNRSSMEQQPQDLYDIPPSELRKVPDSIRNSPAKLHPTRSSPKLITADDVYDIPTNNSPANCNLVYDTPPMPRPAKKPVNIMDGVYDVPPQVTRDISPEKPVVDDKNDRRLSSSSSDSRDSKEYVVSGKELLLIDLDAAMEILVNVQQDVIGSIAKLFGFVSSKNWREAKQMENKMYDMEATCHKLKTSVVEFLRFAQGALANSTHAADKSLSRKLSKLIAPLVESEKIVESAVKSLDERGWQIVKSSSDDAGTPDELDQLVACARGLVEDVRQVASFIQGNSPLIFKRSKRINELTAESNNKPPIAPKPSDLHAKLANLTLSPEMDGNKTLQDRPLPPVPFSSDDVKKEDSPVPVTTVDGPNDYDYVNLEPKETVEKEREEIKASLPKELKQSFENVVKQSEIPVEEAVKVSPPVTDAKVIRTTTLDAGDVQLLRFYTSQVETHVRFLSDAIETFFATIKNNQPPKVFIGHSKFVVISAHKLVFIGDTIQRNAAHPEVKNIMSKSANALCEALKTLVNNTKNAALQFPSVEAVQTMVDSVVDVSHLANDLKLKIIQVTCL